MAAIQGLIYLFSLHCPSPALIGVILILISIQLSAGFLTPIAAALLGMIATGCHLSTAVCLSTNIFENRTATALVVIMTVAVCLLGPGLFSIDAYLFGRREIVIPRRSNLSK